MREKVEEFLKNLASSMQIAKIYTIQHPKFKLSIENLYKDLRKILTEREEVIIGIIGKEFAFDKEVYIELSIRLKQFIEFLTSKGIEKITFYKELEKEEFIKFVSFLTSIGKDFTLDIKQYLYSIGVKNIGVDKFYESKSTFMKVEQVINYVEYYKNSLNKISYFLESVLNSRELEQLDLRFNMLKIMENLLGHYHEFIKLNLVKKYDINTFLHLLNVSILSMYISSKIGFSREECIDIGISALFHDIGKIFISKNILKKDVMLSEEQMETIKSHTILGAQLLLKYVDTLGILAPLVALEHHIRYDLKGYPKLKFPQKPTLVSFLISICDVYDALFQRRTYKKDYPPEEIYKLMIKEKGGLFHPELLEKFFNIIGIWPVGTIVLLSNGKIAIVREQNKDLYSPKVEIVFPTQNKEIIDLKYKKELSIKKSLNPFNEGRKYLNLI
ncbi:MAG: HD domain-containing protein [Candidatus Aenigmatarchaeota archaeon]